MSSVSIESTTDEQQMPMLYDHCCTVYQTMLRYAKKDETTAIVYEGHLTKLFVALNLSVPYYTSVTRKLKDMGCIRQLRRGGGNAPSRWLLVTEPTEELWGTDIIAVREVAARKAQEADMLNQQMRDLGRRLTTVEKALGL